MAADEVLTGSAVVRGHLGMISEQIEERLKGSELAIMTKVMKLAEDREKKVAVTLDKMADAGVDPWTTFRIEKPTLGRFKSNVSTTEKPPDVWKRLVDMGWITELVFNRKVYISLGIGDAMEGVVKPDRWGRR